MNKLLKKLRSILWLSCRIPPKKIFFSQASISFCLIILAATFRDCAAAITTLTFFTIIIINYYAYILLLLLPLLITMLTFYCY